MNRLYEHLFMDSVLSDVKLSVIMELLLIKKNTKERSLILLDRLFQTCLLCRRSKEIHKFDFFLRLIKQDLRWSDITNFLFNFIKVPRSFNDLVYQEGKFLLWKISFLLRSILNLLFERIRIKWKHTLY